MHSTRGIRAAGAVAVLAALAITTGVRGQSAGSAPILLVVNSASPNPFGGYLAEVLRTEGVTSFSTVALSTLDATTLSNARLAILAETPLTSAQASLLTNYVNGGGRLLAMRPDAQIASLFGISPLAATTANGYLAINQAGPGAGLQSVTLPFKGTATHYNLAGATAVADLYADRTTPVARPAVVTFNRTAAWSFDLARSTAYTRQGNPAFAGLERDGVTPIRTNDLFYNDIDLQRVGIPHADVQIRLFRRVIASLLADTQPLPRLWYFPGTAKTILLPTSDSHTSTLAPHTALVNAAATYGANISFYLSRYLSIPAATISQWRAAGHEVGIHPYFTPDNATFPQGYQTAVDWFTSSGWLPISPTERHHSLEWQNWVDPVAVMQANGIRLDTSYYAWGPAMFNPTQSNQAHGYINGSGLPMHFVNAAGTALPVYQQVTAIVDEQLVTGSYSELLTPSAALAVSRQLIDDSQNGGHSAVMAQFHVDYYTYGEVQPWVDGTMAYAQSLGIPMWTAQRWLAFNEARAATAITNTVWSSGGKQLSFSVAVPAGAATQSVLVPGSFGGDSVTSVTLDGQSVTAASMVVNGEVVRVVPVAPLASGGPRNVVVLYGAAPPAPPAITISDATVTEGDTGTATATLSLTLSKPSSTAVTVNYATANGTATAGSDYTAASGTLTFPANTTSLTLPLSVLGDAIIEPNETFAVNLSGASGADIADAQGVVTIQDDDTPPSLSINDVAVTEGNTGTTTATFTLTLSQPSGKTITVNVATADGTATAGSDYVAASGTVTFTPGATTQPFAVTVNGDTAVEVNETFTLNASAPVNVTIGDGQGVGTINNDDAGAGPVSATFQVGNGADDVNEEAGALTTDSPTVWVGNASTTTTSYAGLRFTGVAVPAGASVTGARIEFNAASTQWLALAFEFAAEASANSQPFSATSRPSQRTLLAPRVAHSSDAQWVAGTWYPMDDVTALVQAVVNQSGWAQGNALSLVLRGTGQAWARKFANAFEANATLAPRLVVTYSASGPPTPSLSIGNATVTEGNSGSVNAAFTVTLSPSSSGTVTVGYATADGTATSPADYAATSGTLTFAPGVTTQVVNVPVVGDTAIEPNETFTVTLNAPTNATVAAGGGRGTGTITDDDSAPALSIGNASAVEGNAGVTNAVFTVTLSASSSQTVTVGYRTVDGTATAPADYTATSGTLTFAPGITMQTVSVPVVGDALLEPNETFTVTLSGPANATLATATGVGTIVNDDLPAISAQDISGAEGQRGNTTFTFTLTLSAPSAADVSVSYSTRDGSALARSDYRASSGTVTFAAGTTVATVRINVSGDRTAEPDETFFLDLANATNATLARTSVVATILNDDQ